MDPVVFAVGLMFLGLLIGLWQARGPGVSGKRALLFSALPYAGFGLGMVFC